MTQPSVKASDYITLAEAEKRGFGQADTLKRRCLRGLMPCRKSGRVWLVRIRDLRRFERRAQ